MSTDTIYTNFSDQLYAFIMSKVNDKSLSDDLLQEVFIKIHQKIDQLHDEEKLTSWVFQITRNIINDHFRKSTIKAEVCIEDVYVADDTETSDELGTCMLCLIDDLPLKYKRAVYLSDIKGIPQQEIATKLKVGYSAVKSRVQRGRIMLKEKLIDCNPEDVHLGSERCGRR